MNRTPSVYYIAIHFPPPRGLVLWLIDEWAVWRREVTDRCSTDTIPFAAGSVRRSTIELLLERQAEGLALPPQRLPSGEVVPAAVLLAAYAVSGETVGGKPGRRER